MKQFQLSVRLCNVGNRVANFLVSRLVDLDEFLFSLRSRDFLDLRGDFLLRLEDLLEDTDLDLLREWLRSSESDLRVLLDLEVSLVSLLPSLEESSLFLVFLLECFLGEADRDLRDFVAEVPRFEDCRFTEEDRDWRRDVLLWDDRLLLRTL